MSLVTSKIVFNHYVNNISHVNKYSYFHFVTRLFLVRNDHFAKSELQNVFENYLDGETENTQKEILSDFLSNPKIPDSPERRTFLTKYPSLRPFAQSAFSVLFAKRIWNIDISKAVFSDWSQDDLEKTLNALLIERKEVFKLATYATNFIVLFTHFFNKNLMHERIKNLYLLLDEMKEAGVIPKAELQTYAYFITHVIIDDSLFYTRQIPAQRRSLHRNYLRSVEIYLDIYGVESVSVDCLCEIQLCFRLIEEKSEKELEIYNYASSQISKNGKYIVEPLNPNQSLSEAEHRNVLFILAFDGIVKKTLLR